MNQPPRKFQRSSPSSKPRLSFEPRAIKKPNNEQEVPGVVKPAFPMRINKFLALRKDATRRGADEIIKKNQVFINGRLAVLGDKVQESDKVEIRFRGKAGPMPTTDQGRKRNPARPPQRRNDERPRRDFRQRSN